MQEPKLYAEIYTETSRGKVFDVKCRICGRRVVKSVNRRFHWVEEQLCGLCFWGKIFGYFNSWTVDGGLFLNPGYVFYK